MTTPTNHQANSDPRVGHACSDIEQTDPGDPRWMAVALSHVADARKRWNLPEIKGSELPKLDMAHYLRDEEMIRIYLEEMAKDSNPDVWASAMDDVARARELWGLPAPDAA